MRAGEAGRNEVFQLLFDYIAGANTKPNGERDKIGTTVPVETHEKARIAMTVPVHAVLSTYTLYDRDRTGAD